MITLIDTDDWFNDFAWIILMLPFAIGDCFYVDDCFIFMVVQYQWLLDIGDLALMIV